MHEGKSVDGINYSLKGGLQRKVPRAGVHGRHRDREAEDAQPERDRDVVVPLAGPVRVAV